MISLHIGQKMSDSEPSSEVSGKAKEDEAGGNGVAKKGATASEDSDGGNVNAKRPRNDSDDSDSEEIGEKRQKNSSSKSVDQGSKKSQKKKAPSSDSESDEAPKKRDSKSATSKSDPTKKQQSSSKSSSKKRAATPETEEGGDLKIDLGNNRFIQVREFRGKALIDIREFFMNNSGDMQPGKKGISLNTAQWEKLQKSVGKVNRALEDL